LATPNRNYEFFKRPQLFVEYPYIQPSNLKYVKRRKSNFSLKILILPHNLLPHYSAARDSRITPQTPHLHPNNASADIYAYPRTPT
jgi:hypothetical protein